MHKSNFQTDSEGLLENYSTKDDLSLTGLKAQTLAGMPPGMDHTQGSQWYLRKRLPRTGQWGDYPVAEGKRSSGEPGGRSGKCRRKTFQSSSFSLQMGLSVTLAAERKAGLRLPGDAEWFTELHTLTWGGPQSQQDIYCSFIPADFLPCKINLNADSTSP